MEIAEVEEVHVRRRVDAAQRAVQIDGRGLERNRHALGNHHLHAVASEDVILDGADRAFVVLAAEAGAERRLRACRLVQIHTQTRCERLTQLVQDVLQLLLTTLEGVALSRIGQHDGVHLARQVVEHHHGIGDVEQNVRRAQRIGVPPGSQLGLDVTHAVIGEVTDQATIETRQPGDGRHLVARLELLDEGQRIGALVTLDLDAVGGDHHLMTVHTQHGARRQTNDRVPAPFLAALHRFKQVGVGRIGQFQVDRQRRVEVGDGFAGKRNAVVAFSG